MKDANRYRRMTIGLLQTGYPPQPMAAAPLPRGIFYNSPQAEGRCEELSNWLEGTLAAAFPISEEQ